MQQLRVAQCACGERLHAHVDPVFHVSKLCLQVADRDVVRLVHRLDLVHKRRVLAEPGAHDALDVVEQRGGVLGVLEELEPLQRAQLEPISCLGNIVHEVAEVLDDVQYLHKGLGVADGVHGGFHQLDVLPKVLEVMLHSSKYTLSSRSSSAGSLVGSWSLVKSREYGANDRIRFGDTSVSDSLQKKSTRLLFCTIDLSHLKTLVTSSSSDRLANWYRLIPNCCCKSLDRKLSLVCLFSTGLVLNFLASTALGTGGGTGGAAGTLGLRNGGGGGAGGAAPPAGLRNAGGGGGGGTEPAVFGGVGCPFWRNGGSGGGGTEEATPASVGGSGGGGGAAKAAGGVVLARPASLVNCSVGLEIVADQVVDAIVVEFGSRLKKRNQTVLFQVIPQASCFHDQRRDEKRGQQRILVHQLIRPARSWKHDMMCLMHVSARNSNSADTSPVSYNSPMLMAISSTPLPAINSPIQPLLRSISAQTDSRSRKPATSKVLSRNLKMNLLTGRRWPSLAVKLLDVLHKHVDLRRDACVVVFDHFQRRMVEVAVDVADELTKDQFEALILDRVDQADVLAVRHVDLQLESASLACQVVLGHDQFHGQLVNHNVWQVIYGYGERVVLEREHKLVDRVLIGFLEQLDVQETESMKKSVNLLGTETQLCGSRDSLRKSRSNGKSGSDGFIRNDRYRSLDWSAVAEFRNSGKGFESELMGIPFTVIGLKFLVSFVSSSSCGLVFLPDLPCLRGLLGLFFGFGAGSCWLMEN
ncbi:hypothetical protein OGAPHI_006809 [Ogataea philodendri]|uniref:Uncharacterized protein n=1 Tax=Ogataea philodendri TaxID=1378263 RepID=A0A9P8NXS2_9ASCO|nr:uncharacterized protein OGAPHI_006809 [Ogataea philodendri]KAH3661402.1 hypothetical protein OGAPHI_006809 [Ogataea philodendri]